eukprot:647380-Alexandrium_andersonii.AAC.1
MSTQLRRRRGMSRARGSCSRGQRCPAASDTCASSGCGPGQLQVTSVLSSSGSRLGGQALRQRCS